MNDEIVTTPLPEGKEKLGKDRPETEQEVRVTKQLEQFQTEKKEKIAKPIYKKEPPVKAEVEEKVKEAVEEEVKEKEPVVSPEDYYLTDPLFYKVANYFGLAQRDWSIAKDKLSVIVDWAVLRTQSRKAADVLTAIRALEDEITSPGLGERRYANVHKFVRLLGQKESLEKELKVYKKHEVKEVVNG